MASGGSDDMFYEPDMKQDDAPSSSTSRHTPIPSHPLQRGPGGMESIPEDNLSYGSVAGSMESLESRDPHDGKITLTVNTRWKVDDQLNKRMLASNKPSILIPVAKWLMTILLSLGIVACFVTSKITLLLMTAKLEALAKPEGSEVNESEIAIVYLLITLTMAIPHLINFIRALFVSLCRSDMPWPSWRSIFLGVFAALLESFGLCIFAFKILPLYDWVTSILLMNSVLLLPFFFNFIAKRSKVTSGRKMMLIAGLIFQVGGIVVTSYLSYLPYKERLGDLPQIWHVVAAVFSVSLAWSPFLLQKLVKPIVFRDSVEFELFSRAKKRDQPQSAESSGFNTGSYNTSIEQNVDSDDEDTEQSQSPLLPTLRKTTWKMAIISNFTKLVATLVFSFVFFYVDSDLNLLTDNTLDALLDAWNLPWNLETEYFIINIGTTILGYGLAFIACHIALHIWSFAIPISLMSPLLVIALSIKPICTWVTDFTDISDKVCADVTPLWSSMIGSLSFLFAHVLSTITLMSKIEPTMLKRESAMFWLPGFNAVCLEQWLTVNRRTGVKDLNTASPKAGKQKTKVYICTTMYRETEDEMRQLLESINRVNMARTDNDRFFESHVILDGGIRNKNISQFALQLLSLLEDTLNVLPENCTKVTTPYGMKLSWALPPVAQGVQRMTFNVHLKDGLKVKNKKRWSQIMYMSYVIDFLMENKKDENCYILTTDADVKFTPESVEALLDLMTRDSRVGAVCARTHPMGSGPLVWYQVFEYAIGHWFQKAAEHVLGSVLCAPGCFSVYRCIALKEILTVYATNVEHAFDFLTKDMGEDRWLCTLMVQSGWRIEYCAASENSTNCPSEFEEFYKQRRRWIASTIANLMLLMKQWQIIRHFNQRIPLLFIVYQGALLFSTLIGPSTVILIISGGLTYAWDMDTVTSTVIQILLCIGFALICLYTTDRTQMLSAKLLTFLYAIVMTAVVVGTAEQIVEDLNTDRGGGGTGNTTSTVTPPPSDVSIDIPLSVTTIYFAAIAGIFVLAALLHPRESYCLVNGVWYMLCLPSAYLILIIYSVCNITDRSWGTREEKTASVVKKEPWYTGIRTVLENIFFCCGPRREDPRPPSAAAPPSPEHAPVMSSLEDHRFSHGASIESLDDVIPEPTTPHQRSYPEFPAPALRDPEEEEDLLIPQPVEEWLETGLRERYANTFKRNGYENTMFMSGMTEKELVAIGVNSRAHVQFLLTEIERLPAFEIEYAIPDSVESWLETIGLYRYRKNFTRNHIKKPEDLSVLKSFTRKEIEKELLIKKTGHIKRLLYAIRKLREPTEAEKKTMSMKSKIDQCLRNHLQQSNIGEYDFWKQLIHDSLKPGNKAFGIEGELKDVAGVGRGQNRTNKIKALLGSLASFFSIERLSDLRNSWLLILAVTNTLWLILITTLASKGELTVLGANPLGLSFLFIFGSMLIVQFLAMLLHRMSTLVHFLARAPFKYGAPMKAFWSFNDAYRFAPPEDKDDWEALQTVRQMENQIREKRHKEKVQMSRSYGSHDVERVPLISDGRVLVV